MKNFWKTIFSTGKIGPKIAYFGVKFSVLSAAVCTNDIYHWKVHVLEDSKSLKTRLQTIANFDFYPIFDSAKFPILLPFFCYCKPCVAATVQTATRRNSTLDSSFVAFYFKPQKSIISMVFMFYCANKTLISFGKMKKYT